MDVAHEPAHVARICAKGPAHVAAAAISGDGHHFAFCEEGPDTTRLFELTAGEEVRHQALLPFVARRGLCHVGTII